MSQGDHEEIILDPLHQRDLSLVLAVPWQRPQTLAMFASVLFCIVLSEQTIQCSCSERFMFLLPVPLHTPQNGKQTQVVVVN